MNTQQPEIEVNESDPTPPFEQIRRQIAWTIQRGGLPAGTKLAPVRQLAGDLAVAPGTVARAYRELESAGYVHTKRGGGTRVASSFPTALESGQWQSEHTPSQADEPTPHHLEELPARTQRISAVAVVRNEGNVLLARASEKSHQQGQWLLPGGQLGWGETPPETAVRAFLQLTGLEIEVTDLLEVSSEIQDLPHELQHTVRVIYAAEVVGGELNSVGSATPNGAATSSDAFSAKVDGSEVESAQVESAQVDRVEWVPAEKLVALPVADYVRQALARAQ